MISIELQSAGKKFIHQWIFRELNLRIQESAKIGILGFNGSGKSTLLQVISGFQSLTEGIISFQNQGHKIESDQWHSYISLASPYLELPEEYQLTELIDFYRDFKPFQPEFQNPELLDLLELRPHAHKPVKHFSSGMKQRLKLGMAILSNAPVLLLDEPLSNLDKNGTQWYQNLIQLYTSEKTVIICSNHLEEETFVCDTFFDLGSQSNYTM